MKMPAACIARFKTPAKQQVQAQQKQSTTYRLDLILL